LSKVPNSLSQVENPRGLPRGRGSLPPLLVASQQRTRLLRAVISAVAELGYANVRIADIVARARVSRQSFYAQFEDKEQCFLAAHAGAVELIMSGFERWEDRLAAAGGDPRDQLCEALAGYLDLVNAEPQFARCLLVELQVVGPAGLAARVAAHERIAGRLQVWHERTRRAHPDWPAVPPSRYSAAVGAAHDLVFATVATHGNPLDPKLLRAALDAVLTLLAAPPGYPPLS
jgi:AcrR family transcriptional regulator